VKHVLSLSMPTNVLFLYAMVVGALSWLWHGVVPSVLGGCCYSSV
jgi:hypothetical protein